MSTEVGSIPERRARIFNVQKYSIHDGPGIRTLVFFKGCPLRCKWCSNPEGLEKKYQVMFKEDVCIDCGKCVSACPEGIHYFTRAGEEHGRSGYEKTRHRVNRGIDCTGCRSCEAACPRQALSIAGADKTISEVLEIIQQDTLFYLNSGGGVTLGGGEVTNQPEFAANLLMECQRMGIHSAIETCGYAKLDALLMVAKFCDLIQYDLKHIDTDRHYELTGVRNERILDNLAELIRRGFDITVRMPLFKGLNDGKDIIRRTGEFLQLFRPHKNFQGVELLPYHKLGINKYRQLDMKYAITDDLSLTAEELNDIAEFLRGFNLQVKVLNH